MVGSFAKLTVITNEKRWIFPKDRFVEYEKCDEVWARALGYGYEQGCEQKIEIPCTIQAINISNPNSSLIETNFYLKYHGYLHEIATEFK